uniref:Uncharacterized protein n=1 Tax=Alexandrium monilatum TaxID=311494 RepID=A0A7S4VS82_9DINO
MPSSPSKMAGGRDEPFDAIVAAAEGNLPPPVEPAAGATHAGDGFHLRLLDVNLIVVGQGSVAEELVRRRLCAGGRVFWVWTLRTPVLPSQDDTSVSADAVLGPSPGHWACARHDPDGGTDIPWNLESFVWSPPSLSGRMRSCPEGTLSAFGGLQGSSKYAWRWGGPCIFGLEKNEIYRLQLDKAGHPCGLQGVDAELWEVSGAVVCAGVEFRSLKGVTALCETVAAAREAEVSVLCEEAKPFVAVRPLHVAAWGLVYFALCLVFFLAMEGHELHVGPGDLPWWRAGFALVLTPAAPSFLVDVHGPSLTGCTGVAVEAAWAGLATAGSAVVAMMTPASRADGRPCTLTASVAGFICLSCVGVFGLPLSVVTAWWRGKTQRIRWPSHVTWSLVSCAASFGAFCSFYSSAVLYVQLSPISPWAAACILPVMTSLTEMCVIMVTMWAYRYLILGSRLSGAASTALGDQKAVMAVLFCLTHSTAETSRLVGMLASVVRSPGFVWVPTLLCSAVVNLALRTMQLTSWLLRVVPSQCMWMVCPDAGTILHNEVRLCCGYARFAPVAALGLAKWSSGRFDWPLFNFQATLLLPAAVLMELAEDLVVTSGCLEADAWKRMSAPHCAGRPPLHPSQALNFDRSGNLSGGPAFGFVGLRFMRFRVVVCIMSSASTFCYCLLTLLLGAGYVHGACDAPLAESDRFADGVFWQVPMRC